MLNYKHRFNENVNIPLSFNNFLKKHLLISILCLVHLSSPQTLEADELVFKTKHARTSPPAGNLVLVNSSYKST